MTDKILEVRGLTKTYGGEKRKGAKQAAPTLDVLRGIDIDIYRGDVVCLIGPSGCGKSTFLKSLNRMNMNRNIPYIYNIKDIDWTALKAVGIGKEQLEADGSLDLLLQGKESEIIPLRLCTPVISLTMDATLKLVPGDNNRTIMEINGIRQEESPKK